MNKEIILTHEGVAKLQAELEQLKKVGRIEVAERIKQAIAFGDLSENFDYDDAKNEQAFIEGRIAEIENMLRLGVVMDKHTADVSKVAIGLKVEVLDVETNEKLKFTISGSAEVDPSKNKISNESPIGLALMDHAVGDVVEVKAPHENYQLKILSIHR